MRRQFVKTENYMRFLEGVKAVERRGAAEASMMLVKGPPGHGKSYAIEHWAIEVDAIFLRANVDWTPKTFLTSLAKSLRVNDCGTGDILFKRILPELIKKQLPLVIDEAEFTLHHKAAVLEKIRDFSDRSETLIVLIGMENIQSQIEKHKQISSRISISIDFTPSTLTDTALACKRLAEVDIAPELIIELHRISGGRMRDTLNLIAGLEDFAKRNGYSRVSLEQAKALSPYGPTRPALTVRASAVGWK